VGYPTIGSCTDGQFDQKGNFQANAEQPHGLSFFCSSHQLCRSFPMPTVILGNGGAVMIGPSSTVVGSERGKSEQLRTLQQLVLVALVLAAVAMLNGCLGLTSAGSSSGHPAESLQAMPSRVNFGQVAVGKQFTQSVTVSNTGSASLNIISAQISDPQFSISGMSMPMALASGQSTKFNVRINPSTAGNITGTLTVSGDRGTTPVVVDLAASAVTTASPQLSVSPASINFGSVSNGLKSTRNLVLSNTGSADLRVSVLTLADADFTLTGITTPKTIAAGQSASFTVTFAPSSSGSATGSLAITSNDPGNPTLTVPLSGTGSSTPAGQLSASPASVAFGALALGSSASQQVVITNSGNAAVKISTVAAAGTGYSVTGLSTPTTLNPGSATTLTATFAPAAGNASGSITVASDATNSTLTIPLTGTAAQAGLSISPSSINFGSVVDGQAKSQSFTVTNTGKAALTIAQVSAIGAAYSVSGLHAPATIAAGATTTFSVLFAPTTAGSLTGSVTITSNAPNSPNPVAFSGTGVAASATLAATPNSLSFTNISAGTSGSKNVTISNSGNSSVTISQISVNAKDFGVSGMSTPLTLNAGQNAVMSVKFQPSASENIAGAITVSSSTGAAAVIPVNGVGVQPSLAITPATANFGNVTVGSPSSQAVQLTNSGTGTLTISQVSSTGTGFSTSTLALPVSLTAGQSSTFNIVFSPASAGTASGSVSVVSNAPNSPASVALSGTGVTASHTVSFSTTSLGFGSVNAGSSSTQTVTVTNTGNTSVTVSSITELGSSFALSGAGTPVTLSAGQNLTFSVVFSPTAAGSATGTVTVTSNATGSPTTISLSGTGVVPSSHTVALSWTASTSAVVGYNVYRSTTIGSGYSKINSSLVAGLTYTDSSTLQSSTTYYYVTTAVDSSGNESTFSNPASAAIP